MPVSKLGNFHDFLVSKWFDIKNFETSNSFMSVYLPFMDFLYNFLMIFLLFKDISIK